MKVSIMIAAGTVGLLASITDLRGRRIPNWLTIPAALLGLLMNAVSGGLGGLKTSLIGLGFGLFLLLPFVLVRAFGAGDWKLVGAIGAFLGAHYLLLTLVLAAMIAGIMAAALVLYKSRWGRTVRNVSILVLRLCTNQPARGAPSLDSPDAVAVPLGVPMGISVLLFTLAQLAQTR